MARPDPIRNTYEESPDELKEYVEKGMSERGQKPPSRVPRDTLLQNHEWHLNLLAAEPLPPRNLVLPPPYPPSKAWMSEANQIEIQDICIELRNLNDFVLLRTITDPYVHSSTVTIVEDVLGDVARLTVCNLEDSMIDPIIPHGSILAVKQPCWSRIPQGECHIRVDHPSDFVFLHEGNEAVPRRWRKNEIDASRDAADCKKEGDMMFLKKRFRKALELYTRAHTSVTQSVDIAAQIDTYRKICGVNLVLLRLDAAVKDLSQAISLHAKHNISSPALKLTDPSVVEAWLHNRTTNDLLDIASNLSRPLKDLAARIKFDLGIYQATPDFDLKLMSSYVGPLTLHVDAANYTSDTEIKQTSHHGRGIFAAKAFRDGDLITVEKAFALPGYFTNDRSSECSLYSLADGTATDRAGALLFKELVQKLTHNSSLRKDFFDMDDGGYWKEYGWNVEEGKEIPVDVFRIEFIRRRNCFSSPLRSLDLLTTPSSPVRNGFWIHMSYINHSCLPNSVRTFIGDVLLLRATRDIAKGEEITAQYVAPELVLGERQEKFMGTWGFACDCTLCTVDRQVGYTIEEQRMVIFEELKTTARKLGSAPTVTALKKFAKRLRDLEALYDEEIYAQLPRLCLVHPTLFLAEAWRSLKNVDKMIDSATKLLKYFGISTRIEGDTFEVSKRFGLVNVEALRALKYMTEGYKSQGKEALAGRIRDVARLCFTTITGADVGIDDFMRA